MQSGLPFPQAGTAPRLSPREEGEARHSMVHTAITLDDCSRLTGQATFLVDRSGVCLDVSASVQELLGHRPGAMLGRKLQQFEPRASARTEERSGTGVSGLISRLQGSASTCVSEIELVDSAGNVRLLRMQGIELKTTESGETRLLLSATEQPKAVEHSLIGTEKDPASKDGDSVDIFRKTFVERIHRLNNLLTAFGCQWDLATKTSHVAVNQSAGFEQLTQTFEQLTGELLQLSRSCTDYLSPPRPRMSAGGHPAADSPSINPKTTREA